MTDPVDVVDTETTGVYNSGRILEVATLTIDLSGRVIGAVREFDGVVDATEYDELLRAAHMFGVDAKRVDDRTTSQRSRSTVLQFKASTGVCFTGVAVDARRGRESPRCLLEEHAEELGFEVEETFTRGVDCSWREMQTLGPARHRRHEVLGDPSRVRS